MNKINKRTRGLVIFSAVFALVYNFSLWYASQYQEVPSFVLQVETNIPFLPWTIIPYLSSGAFFWGVFSLLNCDHRLQVFTKRVLFMTVSAGIIFILVPLKYAVPRPEIENPVFRGLFWLLEGVDDPYNQSPSLHVAFSFAFWTVFREVKSRWRPVTGVWLALVALSTLTTYQHHLIDLFTGSILAHLTFLIFPLQPAAKGYRNLHTANFCYLGAWCMLTAAFLFAEFYGFRWLSLLVPAVVLFSMGRLYQLNRVGYMKRELIRISVLRKNS